MFIPRPICVVALLALLVLSGCLVISTLALNQFRKDRQFLLQHCSMDR